jgi:hypothetical protein
MNERQQTIKGIYNFVTQNILIVNYELDKIPQGSLVNYNKDHIFGIEYDPIGPFSFNLRVYTKLPHDNSSQGHVYITEKDVITYLNNSEVVMDIIIETYMIETREQKLKELGI